MKSRKLFEFICTDHGRFDALAYDKGDLRLCPVCGDQCQSVITPVRHSLPGTDPDFPSAWDRWAKIHEEEAKKAKKKRAQEGDE